MSRVARNEISECFLGLAFVGQFERFERFAQDDLVRRTAAARSEESARRSGESTAGGWGQSEQKVLLWLGDQSRFPVGSTMHGIVVSVRRAAEHEGPRWLDTLDESCKIAAGKFHSRTLSIERVAVGSRY